MSDDDDHPDRSPGDDEDGLFGLAVLVAVVLAVLVVVGWAVGAAVAATVAFGGGPGVAETPRVVEDTATAPAPGDVVVGNDSVAPARGTLAFADGFDDGDLVGWRTDEQGPASVETTGEQLRLGTTDCGAVTVSRPVGQREGTVVVSLDWASVARGDAAPVSARLVTSDGEPVATEEVAGVAPTARDETSLHDAVRLETDSDESLVLQLRIRPRENCDTADRWTYLFVDDVRVTVRG